MKVVYFSTATSYVGGAIMALIKTLPFLQKQGIEPCLILKGNGPLEELLREKKIPYYVVKSYDWCIAETEKGDIKAYIKWFVKSIYNIIAELKIFLILRKENADIYHINCMFNGAGARAAHLLGVPVVWHFREFLDLPGETPLFINANNTWKVLNLADKVICVSKYLEETYRGRITSISKVKVVYDGIEFSKFEFRNSAKQLLEAKEIVIGLSGVAPIKNHKDALMALSIIKEKIDRPVILRLAGNWTVDCVGQLYTNEITKIIEEHELENNVQFVGMQDDMNKFWKGCHISLVCSKRESFGLAATEAMACGVCTVCSDSSISGELTDNGKNVFTYKTGNYEQLAEVLEYVINSINNEEVMEKSYMADKYVRENFTIEKSAQKLLKLYREVYNGNIA